MVSTEIHNKTRNEQIGFIKLKKVKKISIFERKSSKTPNNVVFIYTYILILILLFYRISKIP